MTSFNQPWMENINPQLLRRYWISKGCPGFLKESAFGVDLITFKTIHGILSLSANTPR